MALQFVILTAARSGEGFGVQSARQIGKELGVRYVLEGSVQRDQTRVRVTARLTDAVTGGQVSGDTFEKLITRSGGPSRRSSSRCPRSIPSLTAASDRGRRLWLTVFDRRANARSSSAE
jgi:hypothetical protein